MNRIILVLALCLIAHQATAGDAVAIGLRFDGVWTSLTYFRSSTPKGGRYYWTASQASNNARRDLHIRAGDYLARTKIVGQSDLTGYVAIARGHVANENRCITVIGRGNSQREADQHALKKLNGAALAIANVNIVYRYFSYGADSGKHPVKIASQ